MKTIGFIGCGNMGSAIARAVCKAVNPQDVILADPDTKKLANVASELGCSSGSNADAAGCDWVFLAVKPQMMAAALADVAPVLAVKPTRTVIVSMATGVTIASICEMLGGDWPVIRMMPNTPCAIGKGMVQYAASSVTDAEKAEYVQMMAYAGLVDPLPEHLIDAASAVSGCGPAYAYQFIEALADGGVAAGLPRAKAQLYAAQMLAGAAQLVLESGQHPGALKDAVCSPGGSTIQGVRVLEQRAMRGAVIDAVQAAYEKNRELGKK